MTQVRGSITRLEGELADLEQARAGLVMDALRESAEIYFAEHSETLAALHEQIVILCALERVLDVRRHGRVTATVPNFGWTDAQPEVAVSAAEADIAAAVQVWQRQAAALAADPFAVLDFNFPPVSMGIDPTVVYHELTPTERRLVDSKATPFS